MMGIFRCAQIAVEEKKEKHVNICSDSKAVLAILANTLSTTSAILEECIEVLNKLGEVCSTLTLWWVPGHQGVKGKVLADELAKLGAGEPLLGPEQTVGL